MESGSTPGNPTETNSKWSSEEEEDLLDRSVTRAKNVEGGRSETVQEDGNHEEMAEGGIDEQEGGQEVDYRSALLGKGLVRRVAARIPAIQRVPPVLRVEDRSMVDFSNKLCPRILVTETELEQFRAPWRGSLIVKVLGRSLVLGHYLTICQWVPIFFPSKAKIDRVAAWVRVPNLPMEYQNEVLLRRIGLGLGHPVRIDRNTVNSVRGNFARICVEVNLGEPWSVVEVVGVIYRVEYKGLNPICLNCGKVGHRCEACQDDQADGKDATIRHKDGEDATRQEEVEVLRSEVQVDMEGHSRAADVAAEARLVATKAGPGPSEFGPWMIGNHTMDGSRFDVLGNGENVEILEGNLMGKSALMETDMERRGVRFKPRSFNMGVSEVGGVRRLVDSEAMLVEEQSKGSETAVRSEGSGVVNFNSVIPASLDPDPDPGKKFPCAEAEKVWDGGTGVETTQLSDQMEEVVPETVATETTEVCPSMGNFQTLRLNDPPRVVGSLVPFYVFIYANIFMELQEGGMSSFQDSFAGLSAAISTRYYYNSRAEDQRCNSEGSSGKFLGFIFQKNCCGIPTQSLSLILPGFHKQFILKRDGEGDGARGSQPCMDTLQNQSDANYGLTSRGAEAHVGRFTDSVWVVQELEVAT
ncbi:hypothetical protein CRG98_038937 [Punica granatum]|uniref:CCHC-type domain-containing protein n=1 Tax=Punica granatum TaxID=22663 RepID=A0A2I0I9M0_PUNGR|nr:hypothetical protein CRG98_038937 [Punica granatum]